ncbi:MAG TPA: hypothetical protein VMU14_13495 [Acidimicrobiales bacterium]|nr:hypothetical protein [Acidimicrobiales bacterium]
MADVRVEGDDIVVQMRPWERMEALHGDLRLPHGALQGAEVLDDAIHAVHGLRAPGTGVPGLVAVGTYRASGTKLFAVVHHDNRRGVRLRFTGADYDEVIVGCDDPEDVVARLTAAPDG